MSKYTPEQIRAQGFIERLFKKMQGVKRDEVRHNLFFTDYRVRQGRRIGASKKQRLRHAVMFGKLF
jgi:hypothetical protein